MLQYPIYEVIYVFIKETDTIDTIINKLKEDSENGIYISGILYTNSSIQKLKNIFWELTKLDNKPTIYIALDKVIDFELLDIEKYVNLGLNFRISMDNFTYSCEEFKIINNKLDSYLEKIINENMSPYEKYMAIYNFTRKFKEYKIVEEPKDISDFLQQLYEIVNGKYQSCNLRYILDNDYIDCRGFSNILQTLLNKAGIEASMFGFTVYDNDGSVIGGHSRTILNLDDDKYNIHGIFISDATWDSLNDADNLEYSLLPISSMRSPIYSTCQETILFDANNEKEFLNNIQRLKQSKNIFNNLREEIIRMIYGIDRKESAKLKNLNSKDFLIEIEKYILARTNKEINNVNIIRK